MLEYDKKKTIYYFKQFYNLKFKNNIYKSFRT